MKRISFDKNAQRLIRQKRNFTLLKKIECDRPRLLVTKTNAHIFVQLIDLNAQKTLASSSSVALKLKNGNKDNAAKVGTDIGKKIKKLKISEIAFDRGGSKYHGRVKTLADAIRAEGIKF